MIVSELATNAVAHTDSALTGGSFNLDLACWAGVARVVVGDQGSARVPGKVPGIAEKTADANAVDEGGRGLLVVRGLSAAWGSVGDSRGHWVWADVRLPAGLRPLPPEPDGNEAAAQVIAALSRAHPWASIWHGLGTRDWWGSFPAARDEDDIVIAPSPAALSHLLAGLWLTAGTAGRQQAGPARFAPAPAPHAQPAFTPRTAPPPGPRPPEAAPHEQERAPSRPPPPHKRRAAGTAEGGSPIPPDLPAARPSRSIGRDLPQD